MEEPKEGRVGCLHQVTDIAFTSDFCNNYSHPASPASLYLTSPRPRPTRPRVPYLMSSSPSSRVPKSQVPSRASLCPRRLVPVPLLYTANYKHCSSDTELNKPSIESRSVTSRYHGSSISWSQNGELKQQRRRCQRDWLKAIGLYLQNSNFASRALHFFFISQPSLQDYDLKLPNFTLPLDGVDEHSTTNLFLF